MVMCQSNRECWKFRKSLQNFSVWGVEQLVWSTYPTGNLVIIQSTDARHQVQRGGSWRTTGSIPWLNPNTTALVSVSLSKKVVMQEARRVLEKVGRKPRGAKRAKRGRILTNQQL